MIRADVHLPFFRKHLFLALGCFAYALYFIYDGLIAYPKKLKIAEAFESIPNGPNKSEQWVQMATENGWSSRNPAKTADEVAGLIQGQFIYASICVAIAAVALILWARAKGTWVEADEQEIRNSRGKTLSIDAITKIDKRKWSDKGIARIHHQTNGRRGRFILDDFKYDTPAVGQILVLAESGLEPDQVVGDKLERVKLEEKEAAAAPSEIEPPSESESAESESAQSASAQSASSQSKVAE